MKKLIIIAAIAAASCKKELPQDGAARIQSLPQSIQRPNSNQIDCKDCSKYTGFIYIYGRPVNMREYCELYCALIKK